MSRPPLKDRNSKGGLIGLGAIPDQAPVASFNIAGIESLLQTKSFEAVHYLHAPLMDRETLGAPANPNTQGAQRGVFYYSARKIGVVPQQFKLEDRLTVQGLWGIGSAIFNVTGHWLDGDKEQAHFRNRDLLVIPSLTDLVDQQIEYNPSGPLRLNYLAKGVDYLSDGRILYNEGFDFEIRDGLIYWLDGGRKPTFGSGKGAILTVVYWMTPIFIVQSKPHSLRIIPSNEIGHGAPPRDAVYAPQLLIVKPSTIIEEKDLMDWTALPQYGDYPDSLNTTGGNP
jgi:hypothetical protein